MKKIITSCFSIMIIASACTKENESPSTNAGQTLKARQTMPVVEYLVNRDCSSSGCHKGNRTGILGDTKIIRQALLDGTVLRRVTGNSPCISDAETIRQIKEWYDQAGNRSRE